MKDEVQNIDKSLLDAQNPHSIKADVVRSAVFNEDCVAGMKRYPDKFFHLAIVDPPYEIGLAKWDKKPTEEYWSELFRVSKNQIVWGGNYFNLPTKRGWICWNKVYKKVAFIGVKDCDHFELAWTSFDRKATIVNFTDVGYWYGFDGKLKRIPNFKGKIHPAQKHIDLYGWLLKEFAAKGDLILDTHVGSGSSRIACYKAGFDFTGFEIDTEYYEKQEARWKNFKAQMRIEWE